MARVHLLDPARSHPSLGDPPRPRIDTLSSCIASLVLGVRDVTVEVSHQDSIPVQEGPAEVNAAIKDLSLQPWSLHMPVGLTCLARCVVENDLRAGPAQVHGKCPGSHYFRLGGSHLGSVTSSLFYFCNLRKMYNSFSVCRLYKCRPQAGSGSQTVICQALCIKYHKFHQGVMTTAARELDVKSFLQQTPWHLICSH